MHLSHLSNSFHICYRTPTYTRFIRAGPRTLFIVQLLFNMSSSTARVFGDIYGQVSDVVNQYLNQWDPDLLQELEDVEDDSNPSVEECEEYESNTAPDNYDADLVDPYMKDRDMGRLVTEFSGSVQLIRASFEDRISTLSAIHQANLFDKAVARTVLQRVPDLIDDEDEAILELTYKMIHLQPRRAGAQWHAQSGDINRQGLDQADGLED